jgi:hypothetical protein
MAEAHFKAVSMNCPEETEEARRLTNEEADSQSRQDSSTIRLC